MPHTIDFSELESIIKHTQECISYSNEDGVTELRDKLWDAQMLMKEFKKEIDFLK